MFLLLLRPFQDLVEFALAGGRGRKQAAVFFEVCWSAAFCFDDLKALYVQLPEEFYGVYEGVVKGGGFGVVQEINIRFNIP